MKTKIKLALGAALAGIAIMAGTIPGPDRRPPREAVACYSQAEVDLLMKGNKWTSEQATLVLDLACSFSKK